MFSVRELRPGDGPAVLSVLNTAFGREQSWEWYQWKHAHGPWGPSTGWVAEDSSSGDIVGARLFLPWALGGAKSGEAPIPISRAVDGAVAPSAQRKGLFSRCVRAEMDAMSRGARESRLVYSTSVPASREAYRKLGWTIREVRHTVRVALPRPRHAASLVWDDALDVGEVSRAAPLSTAWTREALRWRIHPDSGREYRTVRLRNAARPHGLVFRRVHLRRVPALVVVYAWGDARTTRALAGAVATRTRAPLVLTAGDPPLPGPTRAVGTSTVSVWAPNTTPDRIDFAGLRFQFADLEGTM